MNAENQRRLAARQEHAEAKIGVAEVEAYSELHYPGSTAERDAFVASGGVEILGDGYVAKLSHESFHKWFGTVCDETCPHARLLPIAVARASWWQRILRWKP